MRLANLLWAALAAFGARAGADAAAPQEAAEPIPASRHVIELDRAAYLDLLRTHDTILLEFYAHWCPACRRLAPTLDAVAEAAHASHPHIAVARADASAVEYLSTSFMVDVLPGLAFLHRPGADAVHSVRRVSADFTAGALLDYIGGGWAADEPVGGIATLWCTPTNLCGHLGGLLGELVVDIDRRLNPSGIPPWAFMAVVVSAVYVLGQIGAVLLARLVRRSYGRVVHAQDIRDAAAYAPGAARRRASKRTKGD